MRSMQITERCALSAEEAAAVDAALRATLTRTVGEILPDGAPLSYILLLQLAVADRLRRSAEEESLAVVRESRRRAISWSRIAAAIGISRQGATSRWADKTGPGPVSAPPATDLAPEAAAVAEPEGAVADA